MVTILFRQSYSYTPVSNDPRNYHHGAALLRSAPMTWSHGHYRYSPGTWLLRCALRDMVLASLGYQGHTCTLECDTWVLSGPVPQMPGRKRDEISAEGCMQDVAF